MFNTPWSSPLLSWLSVHRRPLAIESHSGSM